MEQIAEMAQVAAENKILKQYLQTLTAKHSAHEQCETELMKANVSLKADCILFQQRLTELENQTKEQAAKIIRLEDGVKEYVEKIKSLEEENSNVIELKEKECAGC